MMVDLDFASFVFHNTTNHIEKDLEADFIGDILTKKAKLHAQHTKVSRRGQGLAKAV
jgi:hypothetical protein